MAQTEVSNYIYLNTDSGKTSLLVLLDLGTVDHKILLDRLENWVSYPAQFSLGSSQMSILGPLLFNLSTTTMLLTTRFTKLFHQMTLQPICLSQCLEQVNSSIQPRFTQLNQNKREIILFGDKMERIKVAAQL